MVEVVLTGASGCLGRKLLQKFLADGSKVHALVRRPESQEILDKSSFFFRDHLKIHLLPDMTDRVALRGVFSQISPDAYLVHCATSYGTAGAMYSDTVMANVVYPLRLVEESALAGLRKILNCDTVLASSRNIYSRSKADFRNWLKHYAESANLTVVNLYLEQFYSADTSSNRFPNWLVRSCLNNVPLINLSEGSQVRNLIYIDDVVDALSAVVKGCDQPGVIWRAWRVGTSDSLSIRELADLIRKRTGSSSELKFSEVQGLPEVEVTEDAPPFALAPYGWKPSWSLDRGLAAVIEAEGGVRRCSV